MKTICVTVKSGTNSSMLGDAYAAYDGVNWRNSVDSCDSDGNGRVFLDCDDDGLDLVTVQLDSDERVVGYRID